MAGKVSRHSLDFSNFSVDFDIDIDASIEWTHRFDSHGPDFVFAVADIWLRIEDVRHRIVSQRHPGNFIELLRAMEREFLHPFVLQDIEKIIAQGHWGRWMAGYWDRLQLDSGAVDDEALYDLLGPMLVEEGQEGHIAVYEYERMPTFEVATRPGSGKEPVYVWSVFDPAQLAHETRQLRNAIASEILSARSTNH